MDDDGENRPTRRRILSGLAASALLSSLARPAQALDAAVPQWMTVPRRLVMRNLNTGERLNTVYWRDGAYDLNGLAAVDRFFRDWRTGEVVPTAASLLDILWRLQMGARFTVPIEVLSGYRSRQTNEMLRRTLGESVAHRSFHIRAMAADIRLPKLSSLAVAHYANGLGLGGVGYYPDSDFVHVDSGPRRVWVR
ncbi:DUF882 domain-containing protein [Azospirillum sp. sgz302134]